MSKGPVYVFGPYQLDAGARRLARREEPLALSGRQVDVLVLLVARAGQIIPKDTLIEAGWADVAVTDNSLEQAISNLRRVLGPAPDGQPFIETLARRGYRFRAEVTELVVRESDERLHGMLEPYHAFLEGRAAVETLEADAVGRARATFEEVVARAPDYAPGHVGLANALALIFESTRADDGPDVAALFGALEHAREACRLDAHYGEAWATLAFVLSRTGADIGALAAGRRALALEPDNWRHSVRMATAAWGEERLRAAGRALKLVPRLAMAHWLAATVHVARQAFDVARREIESGLAGRDPQSGRLGMVGLHLLDGLVHLAEGDRMAADAAFARELAEEPAGHIYSRQATANTWCAIGAMRLTEAEGAQAVAAFDEALARVPGHPLVLAAMSIVADRERRPALEARLAGRLATLEGYGRSVEVAMIRAVGHVLNGRHAEAADLVHAALQAVAPTSSVGWTLPVEPLLDAVSHGEEWAPALTALRIRAA